MFIPLLIAASLALPPVMPLDEVKPGQKGQCLTVFEGTQVEPFDFVVKGVMRDYLGPGRHLTMVKLIGEKPEFTGVVAGMSGSPCSIDGKLLGALGYAFAAFAKEPIAGITPITDMLDVMKLPAEKRPWKIAAEGNWETFTKGMASVEPSSHDGMAPISAPMSIAGMPPYLREHYSPWFRSMGFEPAGGGAGGGQAQDAPGLEPGGTITAILVRGDVSIAATGTVTTVRGKEITAFGHPFMGGGAISIPMAGGTILNTMATQRRSFKMSAPGPVVGELVQDRLPAIGGILGEGPVMLPVHGTVKTPAGQDAFKFEVARDPGLTPRLVAVGLSSVIGSRLDVGHRGMLRMKASVQGDGFEPIEISRVYGGEKNEMMPVYAAVDVARIVASLWRTPFGPAPGMRIEMNAEWIADPVEEIIETLTLDRSIARPGDEVTASIRMLRVGGKSHIETFKFKVPRAWAGQRIDLVACDAMGADQVAGMVQGSPMPRSVKSLAKWIARLRSAGNLYFMALRKGVGLKSEVDDHAFLPGTAAVTLMGRPSQELRYAGVDLEKSKKRPGVIEGITTVSLSVTSY